MKKIIIKLQLYTTSAVDTAENISSELILSSIAC